MPAGVEVVVADGFATIDFVDGSKKGPGLDALLKVGTPPSAIEKLTRSGPRVLYVVPEGNAREAGLLDSVSEVAALSVPDTSSATDASGAVPPEFPSITNLHAQTVRSGSFSEGEGGLMVSNGVSVGVGVEAKLGEWAEIVSSEDTGGPYETLPEIDNPAGTTELTVAKGYDDGEPDSDWSRPALNAYAVKIGIEDAAKLRTRADVLAAIRAKEAEQSADAAGAGQ